MNDSFHIETKPDETGPGSSLLIACGALAREILDILKMNDWTHLDVVCLPAQLHNTPDAIPDAVRQAVLKHRPKYENIHIVYADCGTGGRLENVCRELGVDMVKGPHCYAFFDGLARFEQRDEFTAFYLTDFLSRQFDAFVWKPLGLDRHPELRDMYFGNYTKLVFLSQTDDADLVALSRDHADRLGLEFEHRPTGYGDLTTAVEGWAHKATQTP